MEKKTILAVFLLLLCIVQIPFSTEGKSELEDLLAVQGQKHRHSGFSQGECPGACSFRCSKTQYHKPCMFFCQKCCYQCRCVPPGTYGHKEVCPCYNNWKTQDGRPKCP